MNGNRWKGVRLAVGAVVFGMQSVDAKASGVERLGQPLNLLQIYQAAVRSDASYRAAQHALSAAREKVPQAQAGLLPVVGLSAGMNRQEGSAAFGDAALLNRQAVNRNWSVQLTQPLWRPVNWLSLTQAEAQKQLAEEQLRTATQELILRVSQSYFEVLVAEQSLRVATTQLEALSQQLALATRGFEVGTGTVTDVHESRARRDIAESQRVAAFSELDVKMAELERILGTAAPALVALGSTRLALPSLGSVQTWMSQAREQALAVRLQEAALAAAEQEVNKANAGHQPTLDLVLSRGNTFASGSIASPANIGSRVQSSQVGVNFNLPLFAGGAQSSRQREAVALREKAREELEAARRQAAALARQAYAAVLNGLTQTEALASAALASRNAVEGNQIGWRLGTRINIDVLNAQQQLFAVQRDAFRAKTDTLLAYLRLKASIGALDEEVLAMINGFLRTE